MIVVSSPAGFERFGRRILGVKRTGITEERLLIWLRVHLSPNSRVRTSSGLCFDLGASPKRKRRFASCLWFHYSISHQISNAPFLTGSIQAAAGEMHTEPTASFSRQSNKDAAVETAVTRWWPLIFRCAVRAPRLISLCNYVQFNQDNESLQVISCTWQEPKHVRDYSGVTQIFYPVFCASDLWPPSFGWSNDTQLCICG